MITKEKRSQMVRYWWSKGEESLASASREFEAGSFSFAMNRLYYAAFYGVSALLMKHDLSSKKHSGVRAAFHQKFIKPAFLIRNGAGSTISSSRIDRKGIMWSLSPLNRITLSRS